MTRVIFKQVTFLDWKNLEELIVKKGWMPKVDKKVNSVIKYLEEKMKTEKESEKEQEQ